MKLENFKNWWRYNFHPAEIISAEMAKQKTAKYATNKEDLLREEITSINNRIKGRIPQGESSISIEITPYLSLFIEDIKKDFIKNNYIVKIINKEVFPEIPENISYLWISWKI